MEDSQGEANKSRIIPLMLKILGIFMILLILFAGGFLFFLSNNGEVIFKKYLQDKINAESNGLYHIEFGKLKINLVNGNIRITNFLMTPDTALYSELKQAGKTQNALYIISFKLLTLTRADLWKIYRSDVVTISNLNIMQPEILIAAFPDTAGEKKGEFVHLYEDIYPVVSKYFRSFHIDSINVQNGMFYSKHRYRSGKSAEGNYTYSAILRDFNISHNSFSERKRVFYSSDIELTVDHFRYSLADSLYFLTAAKAGFSLKKARIYGKDIALVPNYDSEGIKSVRGGELFEIRLPELNISGVDVYKTLVERRVEISSVQLENFRLKMTSTRGKQVHRPLPGTRKKLIPADLFTIISGELKSVSVRNFNLNNAGFEYYRQKEDSLPELKIPMVSVLMDDFFLDSLAHRDREKILYARDIDLQLNGFHLHLPDRIHSLEAGEIHVSTKNSLILIKNAMLLPEGRSNVKSDTMSTILRISIPALSIRNVDIRKAFNEHFLGIEMLEVPDPDVEVTVRSRKPGTGKKDEPPGAGPGDLLYQFTSPYFHTVTVKNVSVSNCAFRLSHNPGRNNEAATSGRASLVLKDFLVDSIHHHEEANRYYSNNIEIVLASFLHTAKKKNLKVFAEKVILSTADSLTEVYGLNLESHPENGIGIDFRFDRLIFQGVNNDKLLGENRFYAKQMTLVKPFLIIRSDREHLREKREKSDEIPFAPGEIIRSIDVEKAMIRDAGILYTENSGDRQTSVDLSGVSLSVSKLFVDLENIQPPEKMIRVDSIRGTIGQKGTIIPDNRYAIEFGSLEFQSHPSVIQLKDLHCSSPAEGSVERSAVTVSFRIPELTINGLPFNDLIQKKDLVMDRVIMKRPDIRVAVRENAASSPGNPGFSGSGLFSRKIKIGLLDCEDAAIDLKIPGTRFLPDLSLGGLDLKARELVIDSSLAHDFLQVLEWGDLVISIPGYSWTSVDSLYTWKLGRIRISTGERHLSIDSVAIIPAWSREEFSRRIGFQQDRVDIRINRTDFSNINFRDLVEKKKLNAEKLTLTGSALDDYRDKRVPMAEFIQKPLPVKMLRQLSFAVNLDTVQLVNGYARYSEQTGKEPGTIFFDRMNAMATNVTNDLLRYDRGLSLDLNGTARLLGKAGIGASFRFPLLSSGDTFSFSATIGALDLTELNPMVMPLQPAMITSGTENFTRIQYVNANDDFASGLMNISYNNLKVKITDTKSTVFNKWKTDFLTFIFDDIVLPSNNPGSNKKLRDGTIFYERDKRKGFFNYVWKSVFSGLKSSVGINTKQQRDLRKIRKTETDN